ncbi:MAG: hypothetical protein VYE73_03330 [Acidobacteriota bacterium]|nr:hypothetical protein [Acidobacteriota bacterium]
MTRELPGQALLVGAIVAATAIPSAAQLNRLDTLPSRAPFSPVPLHFSSPGARSLGIGNAFVAIADDATASEVNPAGLAFLRQRGVAVVLRQSDWSLDIDDLNAATAIDLAGIFSPVSVSGDSRATSDDSTNGVGFAGYMQPLGGMTLSIYHHEAIGQEGRSAFSLDDPFFGDSYSSRNELEATLSHLAVAAGFKMGSRFSLGVSVRTSTLDITSLQELRLDGSRDRELAFDLIRNLGSPGFGPSAADLTDVRLSRGTVDDDDSDLTYSIGLLWKGKGPLSIGLVFKEGGEYELTSTAQSFDCVSFEGFGGAGAGRPGGGPACDPIGLTGPGGRLAWTATTLFGTPIQWSEAELTTLATTTSLTRIVMPDTQTIGLGWAPRRGRFSLSIDAVQVGYSDLDRSAEILGDGDVDAAVKALVEPIDDGTQVHVGFEFRIGDLSEPTALRFGYWTDPDHDGLARIDSDTEHLAVGLGFTLGPRLGLDIAGQFSDLVDEAMIGLSFGL